MNPYDNLSLDELEEKLYEAQIFLTETTIKVNQIVNAKRDMQKVRAKGRELARQKPTEGILEIMDALAITAAQIHELLTQDPGPMIDTERNAVKTVLELQVAINKITSKKLTHKLLTENSSTAPSGSGANGPERNTRKYRDLFSILDQPSDLDKPE